MVSDFTEHKGTGCDLSGVATVIYASTVPGCPDQVESIDASFVYVRWSMHGKEIVESCPLLIQDASFIEEETGLAATFCDSKAFVGTSAGLVRCFCLKTKKELCRLSTHQGNCFPHMKIDELVVALECKLFGGTLYLLVVGKTEAVLFRAGSGSPGKSADVPWDLQRVCGVKLNAAVRKVGVIRDNTCLYDMCFTCAAMLPFEEEEEVVGDVSASPLISAREPVDTTVVVKPENGRRDTEKPDKPESNASHFQGSTNAICMTATFGSVIRMKKTYATTTCKRCIVVYLADSRGYMHVYRIANI